MPNHPSRTLVAAARRIARANGYSVSRHCWSPTRHGWGVDDPSKDYLDERMMLYSTQGAAWIEAAAYVMEVADYDTSAYDAAGVPDATQREITEAARACA